MLSLIHRIHAPIQIYPFIVHSQCCSKHCWANLAHSAILKSPRELRNKNSSLVATFLRLGVVAISPIVDCCPKTRRKWLCRGLLPRCQGGGELPIAKKMQKSRDFCFRDGRITATGRICRKTRKVSNGNEGKCLKRRRGYDNSRANTAKRNKRKRQLGIAAAFCSGCIYANHGQDYRINGKGFAVFR